MDRPVYVKYIGDSFTAQYTIVGVRPNENAYSEVNDLKAYGQHHINQQGVFCIPGEVVVKNEAAPSLIVGFGGVYFVQAHAYVQTAPTGSSLKATINSNGAELATVDILAGFDEGVSVGESPPLRLESGDVLSIDITQIGSTFAGSDLTLSLRVIQVGI